MYLSHRIKYAFNNINIYLKIKNDKIRYFYLKNFIFKIKDIIIIDFIIF